jgi:hypothetical protein
MSAGELVDDKGNCICVSCRRTLPFSENQLCVMCEKFVCTSCAVYHRQLPYGYHCKGCHGKSLKSSKPR